jgi:hypothetical protein
MRVMFWGAFSVQSPISLVPIAGTMTSTKYIQTLETNIVPYLDSQPLACLPILQHDNAPAHTSLARKEFLHQNGVEFLDWPPYSPDLNPIENLWGILKENCDKKILYLEKT